MITVRLNLTLSQDMHYIVVADVIPAGTEVVNRRLLTETQTVKGPTLRQIRPDDPFWYWDYVYFDRTEVRDEGARLYADYRPRGS